MEHSATYTVFMIGAKEEIEAVSFQDAAQKMMTLHHLTSVGSIAVKYDEAGGTIELLGCQLVNGKLEYNSHSVIDVKGEDGETRERLEFLASGEAIEDQ